MAEITQVQQRMLVNVKFRQNHRGARKVWTLAMCVLVVLQECKTEGVQAAEEQSGPGEFFMNCENHDKNIHKTYCMGVEVEVGKGIGDAGGSFWFKFVKEEKKCSVHI